MSVQALLAWVGRPGESVLTQSSGFVSVNLHLATQPETMNRWAGRLHVAIVETLGGAIAHYEQTVSLPIPDKLPMPLRVHRHEGEPCPRCEATLRAVHFEDYVIAYCPDCQTEGRVLKDRRLSRLLR